MAQFREHMVPVGVPEKYLKEDEFKNLTDQNGYFNVLTSDCTTSYAFIVSPGSFEVKTVGNDRFAIPGDCQNEALEAFPDYTLESTRRGLRPSDRPLSDDDYLRRAGGARGCSVLA